MHAELHHEITTEVRNARAEVEAKGWDFMGRGAILATSFLRKAVTVEKRRKISPRVAAQNFFLKEIYLDLLRAFQEQYQSALQSWRCGDRSVEFPPGTWWMRVFHNAAVMPAPA